MLGDPAITTANIALEKWRGEEHILNFLFAIWLQL